MIFRLEHSAAAAVLAAALLLAAPAGASAPAVDAATVALHAGNASNAVALATQALADPSLTPRDRARVLLDRGLAHEMLGEHDAALLDFTEAINARALAGADLVRAFYDRGVALDELGQTEDAIGDYSAAIRLEPRHAAALNNRANAYRRIGRLAEAGADYKASLAAGNPHPEYPNYGLGQIAEAQSQPAQARTYYQAAIAANPQFTLAAERLTTLANAPSPSLQPPPAIVPPPSTPPASTPAPPSHTPLTSPTAAAPSDDGPVVLRPPPGMSAAPPANDGAVHLRPPPGARAAPATDDGTVHLRPPGASTVHLHPPRPTPPKPPPRAAAAAAAPDLKPALGDSTHGQWIQLGAWRNEADAADAWNRIVGASGTLMAGLAPQVVPIDLPGKGRYYRLRAGPVYDNVTQLCGALLARKLECMVVRP
jgi:Tfp pilus assembly protein PilF